MVATRLMILQLWESAYNRLISKFIEMDITERCLDNSVRIFLTNCRNGDI